ncbi:fibronectin type III domain-containing protein [Patescibacteria group bacterium]|nr:fibronectin type III domain-containing protein [Patescibacteria group bacterium]
MQKIATKNKMFFYLVTAITALFLAVNVMPKANAQGLSDDIMAPDDVENLQIELYDGAALLSWDVATDDTGVIGYKIYSGSEAVTAELGEYENDVIDAGDVIEYLVEDLTNGEELYFAITAYDAAGNESDSYSNEVYGTPDEAYGPAPVNSGHAAADEEGPTVNDSQATDAATVKVIFNEPVVLPANSPETAFNIIDNSNGTSLTILAAELDASDTYGATVILTTDPQEAGAEYILTAGIEIQDLGGNPIISGTSDTAAFIGSNVAPGENPDDLPSDDFESPSVVSAEALSATEVAVEFSEAIILNSDPETNFYIAEVSDATNTLDIVAVERNEAGSTITITTSEQSDTTYALIVTDVIDEAGNAIDETANTANFDGYADGAPAPDDLNDGGIALSPENVRNFVAAIVRDVVIRLTWTPSNDASIVEQILYQSTDGGTNYDDGRSLDSNRDEIELSGLTPGIEYYFKLTTRDTDGNESDGVITHIRLPETGVGLGLLVGASMGLAAVRRKKKQ